MMHLGRRNQGCITLFASVTPPYKTHMIVLADNSPLTDVDDDVKHEKITSSRAHKNVFFLQILVHLILFF
jgi:hypothetical protein